MKMRDAADHKAMTEAGKAWLRIKKSAQRNWSDWTMTIGPALMRARSEAMAIAGTNQPKGKGYSTAMSGLLTEYHLDDMDGVARNDMLSIMDHLAAVDNWRNKQKNPTRLNHPTTVWRGFKQSDDYKAVQMEQGEYRPKPENAPREKPTLLEEAVALRDHVTDLVGQLEERTQERDQAREEVERLGGSGFAEPTRAQATVEQLLARVTELEEELARLKGYIAELEAALAEANRRLPAAGLETEASDSDEESADPERGLLWAGDADQGYYARAGRTLYVIEHQGEHLSQPWEVRTVSLGGKDDPAAILAALLTKYKTIGRLNSQHGDRLDDPVLPPRGHTRTYAKQTATLDEAKAQAQAAHDSRPRSHVEPDFNT